MIHFLSGLPRSGSTLLAALLAQHPKAHVSATNDLLELVVQIRNSWVGFDAFRAQGLERVKPRIRSALRGLVEGFYANETNNTVIDKNRAWPGYIDLIEDVLERKVKIVCPVRDIKEVVASFERLHRQHPLTAPHGVSDGYFQQQTIQGRAEFLLSPSGTIGLAARRLLDAIARGYRDRLLIVPYPSIVGAPEATCIQVFAFLGLRPIEVDAKNVKGPDASRDTDVWGLPLHKIKSEVQPPDTDWRTVLPVEVGRWIDEQHATFQSLLKV